MRCARILALVATGVLLPSCWADSGDTDLASSASRSGVDTTRLSRSLAISEIAAFQPLKITLAKAGALASEARAVPLLANRETLVRVYVAPRADRRPPAWPVKAVLEVSSADGAEYASFEDTKLVTVASDEAALDSTFNFRIPAASLPVGAKFQVSLVDSDPAAPPMPRGVPSSARFPAAGGTESLAIESTGEKLKVVLVPVRFDTDGSGNLPDTSPEQIERYRQAFHTMYPISSVEISVHDPISWTAPLSLGKILREMYAIRAAENPSPDTYYYGSFAPTATFAEYCPSGCVTGLSGVIGPDAVASRASVGVGFTGTSSARTFAHEVGHAHGRRHTPCGNVAGPDPSFPHAGGSIGLWGWDLRTNELLDPALGKDVMSYCRPAFISDYTYLKLHARLKHVNEMASIPPLVRVKASYRLVDVDASGTLELGQSITLDTPPGGEPHEVRFQDKAGVTRATSTAFMIPYDHFQGGILYVPEDAPFERLEVEGVGATR